MALTSEQRDAFDKHLRERVKNLRCYLCENNTFQGFAVVNADLSAPRVDGPGVEIVTLPFAALVCSNCGNTLFVHLGKPGAGVLP